MTQRGYNFKCSCGMSGILMIVDDPSVLNVSFVARDCKGCGNTIIVTPTAFNADGSWNYHVRICKTEHEETLTFPVR